MITIIPSLCVCKSLEAEGAMAKERDRDFDLPETTTLTRMATLIGLKLVTATIFESRNLRNDDSSEDRDPDLPKKRRQLRRL